MTELFATALGVIILILIGISILQFAFGILSVVLSIAMTILNLALTPIVLIYDLFKYVLGKIFSTKKVIR